MSRRNIALSMLGGSATLWFVRHSECMCKGEPQTCVWQVFGGRCATIMKAGINRAWEGGGGEGGARPRVWEGGEVKVSHRYESGRHQCTMSWMEGG